MLVASADALRQRVKGHFCSLPSRWYSDDFTPKSLLPRSNCIPYCGGTEITRILLPITPFLPLVYRFFQRLIPDNVWSYPLLHEAIQDIYYLSSPHTLHLFWTVSGVWKWLGLLCAWSGFGCSGQKPSRFQQWAWINTIGIIKLFFRHEFLRPRRRKLLLQCGCMKWDSEPVTNTNNLCNDLYSDDRDESTTGSRQLKSSACSPAILYVQRSSSPECDKPSARLLYRGLY